MAKRWYDPEYDRLVTEDVIKAQWSVLKHVSRGTYEQFRESNFQELRDYVEFNENGQFVRDWNNLEELLEDIQEFGGSVETREGKLIKAIPEDCKRYGE